jgi:hypothetical protein
MYFLPLSSFACFIAASDACFLKKFLLSPQSTSFSTAHATVIRKLRFSPSREKVVDRSLPVSNGPIAASPAAVVQRR